MIRWSALFPLTLAATLSAQQPPPRDTPARPATQPTGTAVIRGRVVAADTGNPIRRATVTLSLMPPATSGPSGREGAVVSGVVPGIGRGTVAVSGPVITINGVPQQNPGPVGMIRPRSATTDQQGAFEFTGLPAGAYRLVASAGPYVPQYLSIGYGAARPNGPGSFDPGRPIAIVDGQVFDKATIALPRGAVISGRVMDDDGTPLARVQVSGLFFVPGNRRAQRFGNASTDDLGQFRMFGLQPGEYQVLAETRGGTYVPPNAPPESEDDRIGFLPTFYPGTADEGAAQRVRARAGAETSGIEIRLLQGRLFHLSGFVSDSQGRPAARANGQLMLQSGGMSMPGFGFSTDEQGRFQMRNIPPGAYRLVVRQQSAPPGPDQRVGEPGEAVMVPVTIAGADLENLALVTSPGATISGRVVFEQGTPSPPPTQMRVVGSPGDPQTMAGLQMTPSAIVQPDLTFTMKRLMGELILRIGAAGQSLKSVTVNGRDITDTPYEFKQNDSVVFTLTSRTSTVEGTVTDATGKPASDGGVILFSEDKASWRPSSIRTRRTGIDPDGHYRLNSVLAGRYYLVALTRDRFGISLSDAESFEQLAKDATTIVVGEDEQRTVDLKIVATPVDR